MARDIPTFPWRQVDGDMNPSQYGAIIATANGEAIELIEIQPVREYVSEGEALEVGFPFWSKEAYYTESDLDLERQDVQHALKSCDLDLTELPREQWALATAIACMRYGIGVDESEAGWARDVLGDRRVEWWGRQGKRPMGWRYIADEDVEFRRMQRESRKAS